MTLIDKIPPTATGPLVVAPVYDGLCTFEFAIAAEIFGLARPEMGAGWYRFASAAIEPGVLRAHGGLRVTSDGGPELLDEADLIVIAGWKGADVPVPPALAQRLRAAWARGARLASICSGAFVLAATGLLDGRRAATHWRYAQRLRERHPAIDVDADVLYVDDKRVLTSAGSAAGIDLMIEIVRQDFGSEAANSVARRLVMPAHRTGGQAQFLERPVPVRPGSAIGPLLDRIRADLAAPWSLERMARECRMSLRTFVRRFTEATGSPPGEWLVEQRLEEAKRLLALDSAAIDAIAERTGLGSADTMRHHFRKHVGISPREFRLRFGSEPAMASRAIR